LAAAAGEAVCGVDGAADELLCEPTSLGPASNKRRADATSTRFPTRVLFRRTHLRVAHFSCDINPGTPFMAFYKAQTPGGIRLFVKSQKSTPKTVTFCAEQGSISKLGYLVFHVAV
jgi:cytochrome c biogenesis protein ResB